MAFRGFIQPCDDPAAIAALTEKLGGHIRSGYHSAAGADAFLGQNRIFDRIAAKQASLDMDYEDQCSVRYYFDLVRTLRDLNGQYDRVVEVGVFLGGSSSYLAGCVEPFDFDIDMVDVDQNYLLFAYERVRRMYPEAAKRIRLFHGDLPTYVRHVMLGETDKTSIIHHDGAHDFNQVVRDMGSLYYAQEQVLAVIAQDTHLRGSIKHMNFVDLALTAVFGKDMKFAPIGAVYEEWDAMTGPDKYFGNYFIAGAHEGMVLPIAMNQFHYPHPRHDMDDLLPYLPATEEGLAAAA
jgi:hypothetical protein